MGITEIFSQHLGEVVRSVAVRLCDSTLLHHLAYSFLTVMTKVLTSRCEEIVVRTKRNESLRNCKSFKIFHMHVLQTIMIQVDFIISSK